MSHLEYVLQRCTLQPGENHLTLQFQKFEPENIHLVTTWQIIKVIRLHFTGFLSTDK